MKTCHTCKQELPETEFYRHYDNLDGLDNQCKACKNAAKKRCLERGVKKPPSTQYTIDTLRKHGIPCSTGIAAGFPLVDIAAYGYLKIEAKSAKPDGYGWYKFGFTRSEREKRDSDFYALITVADDVKQIYVLAANDPVIKDHLNTKLIVKAEHLQGHEDAFYLIKQRLIRDVMRR